MLGLVRDAKRSNMDPSGSPPCKSEGYGFSEARFCLGSPVSG